MKQNSKPIYLDHAATTSISTAVLEAMYPYLTESYGNPSSMYSIAQEARQALDNARQICANVLGARSSEIVFTSGGTESDNSAIMGAALALKANGNHIVTTSIEHHAVLYACDLLQTLGFEITYLPVSSKGLVDLDALQSSIKSTTTVVSIMFANNEIGSIQPISEISEIIKSKQTQYGTKIAFHSDAVQAAGYLDLDVNKLGVDLLSLSAHKFEGPKGVGLLFIRRNTPFIPTQVGGSQERDRRAGTENVAGIVGMSTALRLAAENRTKNFEYVSALRDHLINSIFERIDNCQLNGDYENRLPNNVNFSFKGVEGEPILLGLDLLGIAASSGSACSAASLEPSHVLLALGLSNDLARASLRLSLGPSNTLEEINSVVDKLQPLIRKLRTLS